MSAKSDKSSRRRAGSKSKSSDEVGPTDAQTDAAARLTLQQSDKLYYRIGEVSRITGVKAHVLRYWETEFRWMAPPKSRSKQRLYRKRDIEFVWLLKQLLWEERYTIAGARQRIQELGVDGALALLDQPSGAAAVDAASNLSPSQASGASAATPSNAVWVNFRSALGEMETELLALRGLLQDGA